MNPILKLMTNLKLFPLKLYQIALSLVGLEIPISEHIVLSKMLCKKIMGSQLIGKSGSKMFICQLQNILLYETINPHEK